MSGYAHPLWCCDNDCASVNHCYPGGEQCAECGMWFCSLDLDRDGLCEDCARKAEEAREEEEEDEDEES